MRPVSAAALAAVLSACSPPSATTDPAALHFRCGGPFVADASETSIAQAFGAANVAFETVPGPEGAKNEATVVFGSDPTRRLEILWADPSARKGLLNASIALQATAWTGPAYLRIGSPLADVEAANGGPFKLAGFDWDYAGMVTDWMDGKLAPHADACVVGLQFRPGDTATDDAVAQVSGDRAIRSDDAAMRATSPIVMRMALGYPAPTPPPP